MGLKKFQTVTFQGWKSNVTKLNHISSLYHAAPQKATNFMVELLSRSYAKTLEATLNRFPTKEFDSDDEYTWDVIAAARKNVPLIEARTAAGATVRSTDAAVGAGGEEFYLVFGEDWFFDGEVIFGNLNEFYPMIIKGDAKYEGSNVVYKVQLMNGSLKGIPGERLQLGERFSPEYAPVERELSRKVGGVRHIAPASMRNEWTTIRMQDTVSGALLDKKIAMGIPMVRENANGKVEKSTETLWMHYEEYEFDKQWCEYKNNAMAYSVSNRNENGEYLNFGKSGEAIRQGDGLYAQMERGNIIPYNVFSLKFLEDLLTSFSAGKIDFKDRTFLIRTGEFGMLQFSRAAKSALSGWTEFDFDATDSLLKKEGENSFTLTNPQINKYIAPNGLKIQLECDPHYDDPVHNKITHPAGGVAQSYVYDIFDLGTSDQPNIFKTAIKGKPEYWGWQYGLRNPFTGAYNNPYMSFDKLKFVA